MTSSLCRQTQAQKNNRSSANEKQSVTNLGCAGKTAAHRNFFLSSLRPAAALPQNANTCQMLSITNPSTGSSATSKVDISSFLEKLENALTSGESKSFVNLLHPAIIKSEEEKHAIFATTLDSYEIKGKKLQRSYLYELKINESKPTTDCRNHIVTAVVGPKQQWAMEYAFTNAGEQARIFFLIGTVPPALSKLRKEEKKEDDKASDADQLGIVHIHTQNWSFGSLTPETLFAESRKWALLDDPVAAWAFATAAKRIVQSNGYFFDKRYAQNIADYPRIDTKFNDSMADLRNKLEPETKMTVKEFTTVFKEKRPEIGVKVEASEELAVNDQINQCKLITRNLAPRFAGSRKSLTGLECMMYRKGQSLEQLPGYGTMFISFKDALKDGK